VQQMDALRDRAKADHEARIDAMFASLAAIGNAHPPARPVILGIGNKVGGFVAGVAAEATNIVGTVKSAVAAAGRRLAKLLMRSASGPPAPHRALATSSAGFSNARCILQVIVLTRPSR
jgi:hypothetical protein